MQLLINGEPGSGKGASLEAVAEKLSMHCKQRHYFMSAGDLFRKKADSIGKETESVCHEALMDQTFDKKIDRHVVEYCTYTPHFVLDSKIAHVIVSIPYAVRILLTCDPRERIRRLVGREFGKEFFKIHGIEPSQEEKLAAIEIGSDKMALKTKKRVEDDNARFSALYGVENIFDLKHYDDALDTTHLTKQEQSEALFRMALRIQQKLTGKAA